MRATYNAGPRISTGSWTRLPGRLSVGTVFQTRPSSEIAMVFSSPATDPGCPFQTLSRFRNSSVSFVPGRALSRK